MIISYARLRALSCILPLPSGAYLVCLACLSKSSALSKMGRLWALTFTPVIVMTFEFCQRGATVDTPFLTVLKTWMSPFEHSVIIHVCVRLEFPEVSARAPRLRIPELDRLVSGFAPNTCILPLRGKVGLVDHPHPSPAVARCHRLVFAATGNVYCRPALFVAGQHFFVPVGTLFGQDGIFCRPIAVHLLLQIFLDSCIAFAPLHTRVWRDLPLAKLVL